MPKDDPIYSYTKGAVARHPQLLSSLNTPHEKWDIVVLQSYQDDLEGEKSLYMEYAPKFAALAKAQGAVSSCMRRRLQHKTKSHWTRRRIRPRYGEGAGQSPSWPPNRRDRRAYVDGCAPQPDGPARSAAALRQRRAPEPHHGLSHGLHFYAALFDRSPEGLAVERSPTFVLTTATG